MNGWMQKLMKGSMDERMDGKWMKERGARISGHYGIGKEMVLLWR